MMSTPPRFTTAGAVGCWLTALAAVVVLPAAVGAEAAVGAAAEAEAPAAFGVSVAVLPAPQAVRIAAPAIPADPARNARRVMCDRSLLDVLMMSPFA
jgi:hypothetical protein